MQPPLSPECSTDDSTAAVAESEPAAAESLRGVLAALPPVQHGFAYGSSVFAQPGAAALRSAPPMVDYLFAVDDPQAWHATNLERNARHYSPLMRAAGPSAVIAVADSVGAGVHFNPFVRVGSQASAVASAGGRCERFFSNTATRR